MLRCDRKIGVAFQQIRAHSEFTEINFLLLVSVLSALGGMIFNPRAIGGYL
jgi:hypothetical protein